MAGGGHQNVMRKSFCVQCPAGFGAAPNAQGWQQPRKVDATPLEPTIRARPTPASGPRKVQIAETKSFPWVAVSLAALIAVAVGVVLVYSGKLPF